MCFLSRWQEEIHNILLRFMDSVWPFQHLFPIVPASSAGQERVVSHVLPLTHPLSLPRHLWFSFSALGSSLLLQSWLKGAPGPCRCRWNPQTHPPSRWRALLRMLLSKSRASHHSRINHHCILCWRNGDALMLCYQSHFLISVVHLAVILLPFTGILGSYTGAKSKHQPYDSIQTRGKWPGGDTERKKHRSPRDKEGWTSLISCREKWLQKGVDLTDVLISGYPLHLTQTSTDTGSLKGNSELCCLDTGMGEADSVRETDVSPGASAALEPGCVDTVLLLHLPPFKGDHRQCFPDLNISALRP